MISCERTGDIYHVPPIAWCLLLVSSVWILLHVVSENTETWGSAVWWTAVEKCNKIRFYEAWMDAPMLEVLFNNAGYLYVYTRRHIMWVQVKFQVLNATTSMMMAVFLFAEPCSLEDRGAYCLPPNTGGIKFLWNFGRYLSEYTAQHSTWKPSSY